MEIAGVELQYIILAVAAIGTLIVWGLKKYQVIMADGKVSLNEIIETLTEAESLVDDVVDAVETVVDEKEKADAEAKVNE